MSTPLYVRGGVWTNVEDQILKAAVQKYGINQWARVSSLLPKKSALQAKARWNEWLSPLVDNNEWTKEQDEKLLTLSKQLPNQWRTISSILGKTATHSVERYQKLINDAAGLQDDGLGLTGPGIESLPASGNQNLGNIGDVNLNPESKPARPDDEDLEDDEREMLAEAKARLANTQGKKAKRKVRERMLEESKRIALLQKRRELKAAGINISLTSKNKKKKKEVDYTSIIPNEVAPAVGPYDITEENQENEQFHNEFDTLVARKGISLKEVDDKIAKEKKMKERKVKKREVEHNAIDDFSKRRKLNLSEPSMKYVEHDLDQRIDDAAKELKQIESSNRPLLKDTTGPISEKAELASMKKIDKALISQMLKASISKLPEPKHHFGKTQPIFDTENIEIHLSSNVEVGEDMSSFNDEGVISLVTQRNLPIPDPTKLENLTINELIKDEFFRLIETDYKRYKNSSYNIPLRLGIDLDTRSKVISIIDEKVSDVESIKQEKFELPQDPEIAKMIISKIHELNSSSLKLEEDLSLEFSKNRETKLSEIKSLLSQLVFVSEEYEFVKHRFAIENKFIDQQIKKMESNLQRFYSKVNSIQNEARDAKLEIDG